MKEKDNLKTNSDKQILLDKKAAKYATNNSELSLLSQSNMNGKVRFFIYCPVLLFKAKYLALNVLRVLSEVFVIIIGLLIFY